LRQACRNPSCQLSTACHTSLWPILWTLYDKNRRAARQQPSSTSPKTISSPQRQYPRTREKKGRRSALCLPPSCCWGGRMVLAERCEETMHLRPSDRPSIIGSNPCLRLEHEDRD